MAEPGETVVNTELELVTEWLARASAELAPHYFQLPVAGAKDAIFRERAYCYELYHLWRCQWIEGFRFSLNGGLVGTENSAPYALYSNNGSDLYAWTPAVGTYTLSATPFSKDHALGLKGAGQTITFKVVNQRPPSSGGGGDVAEPVTEPAPPPAPEPVPGPVPGGNDDGVFVWRR